MRVAGIGFRKGAPLDSLREVLRATEAQGGPAEALASLPEKSVDTRLQTLAAERGLPLIPVAVAGQSTPTKSPRVLAMHAAGSVAEAAALVAAGAGAQITVARITAPDGMATCAMAESKETKT